MAIDVVTLILLPIAINIFTSRLDSNLVAPELDRWQRRKQPVSPRLQNAINRAFFLAQRDIARECRQELHGNLRIIRGFASDRSKIQWLDRRIKDLDSAIDKLESHREQVPQIQPSFSFSTEISALIRSQGQPTPTLIDLEQKLLSAVPAEEPNPPELYQTKIASNLLQQTYQRFLEITRTDGEVFKELVIESQNNITVLIEKLSEQMRSEFTASVEEIKNVIREELRNASIVQVSISSTQVNISSTQISSGSAIANPFIPLNGILDDATLLFGREKEIQRVFELLNSGSSVALIGERSIGKSSLLTAICEQAQTRLHKPRQPIYLNLQIVCDEDDFYAALCDGIGISTCRGYPLTRALKDKRLLLVLDEVEKIAWDGFTNQVRSQLRGLAEGNKAPLRLVVAACNSLNVLFPDSQDIIMTSPFKGICQEEPIKPWDAATTRAFIESRLAPTAVRFLEPEILEIFNTSQGHPQKVVQRCYATYAQYLTRQI